jgi:hypothetical protein
MLCTILGIHGGDYEGWSHLEYKHQFRTAQETHYFFAIESSRLMLCKIKVFTDVNMKNVVFWDVTPCGSCKNRRFGEKYRLHHHGEENERDRKNVSNK